MEVAAQGPLDAVGDRQLPALLRLQIVLAVGIPRGDDVLQRVFIDHLDNLINNPFGLQGAEGAINKVVLHINDQQNFPHLSISFSFFVSMSRCPALLRAGRYFLQYIRFLQNYNYIFPY